MTMLPVRGFSLIELMVSLALIALFATLAQPLHELTVRRTQESELRDALRQIRVALDTYRQASEEGRILVQSGASGYPRSLDLLVSGVKDARDPSAAPIHFLRRIPRDPFAAPDVKATASWGLRSYLSSHDRPSPGDDVYDVYSLSPATGINGIPYREW
ncbi:MAG: type II secretion system protein [Rhodocyclaceae bacterium]|nr:type II secretion system protein [Rhodocyclaceae bacterium]MDZ4213949.1 type II secretion system protein [Rhodocyclaceae bacterium]